MTEIFAPSPIRLVESGLPGESLAAIARRTGAYGVLPSDSDDAVLAKLAQFAIAAGTDAEPGQFIVRAAGDDPLFVGSSGTGADSGLRTDLASPSGSALAGFQQQGDGARAENVGDALRRVLSLYQFCAGDGVADDTDGVRKAIAVAIATGLTLDGHGGVYRLTSTVNMVSYLKLQNATFLIDHPGIGLSRDKSNDANPGYHGVARAEFRNISVSANQDAAIAWDRDQYQLCVFENIRITSTADTTFMFDIGIKYSNVAYWNQEAFTEIETGKVAYDLNDYNDGRFYACKVVRFANVGITNAVRFSGGCSGVQFFGLSCETEFHDAVPIKFHPSCEAIVFVGVRIEARSGSTNVLPIQFNGARGNTIIGAYTLGAGIANYTDAVGDNELYYYTVSGMQRHMGGGILHMPTGTVTLDTFGQFMFNALTNKIDVYTTSLKSLTLNPADSVQDMNGFPIINIDGLTMSGPATNPGAGKVALGNGTQTTVGAAGAASGLPAAPLGYLKGYVGSTQVVIPYYAA